MFDKTKKLIKNVQDLKEKFTNSKNTVKVYMPDGTIDSYDEHFIITDKIHCVTSFTEFYHYCLDCRNLHWELMQSESDGKMHGMTIKEAKSQGKIVCRNCDRNLYLYNHDRWEEMT